jgi:hypothetical protein
VLVGLKSIMFLLLTHGNCEKKKLLLLSSSAKEKTMKYLYIINIEKKEAFVNAFN